MRHPFIPSLLVALLPSLATAAEETAKKDLTIIELLSKGGWVMTALVALSIFTLILVLLYFLTLRRSTVVTLSLIHI